MRKGKEAERPVVSGSKVVGGLELGLVDVMGKILAEIQGLRGDMRIGFREAHMELREIRRTGRELTWDARELANCFLLDSGVRGEEVVQEAEGEAENEQGSEMEKDVEMEDETLQ